MKRVYWTVGLALAGLCFGWYGQGPDFRFTLVAFFAVWGGFLGFAVGSAMLERVATVRIILIWSATFALISVLLFPLVPSSRFIVQVAGAGSAGALFGVVVGTLHFVLLKWRTEQSRQRPPDG